MNEKLNKVLLGGLFHELDNVGKDGEVELDANELAVIDMASYIACGFCRPLKDFKTPLRESIFNRLNNSKGTAKHLPNRISTRINYPVEIISGGMIEKNMDDLNADIEKTYSDGIAAIKKVLEHKELSNAYISHLLDVMEEYFFISRPLQLKDSLLISR